MSEPRERFLQCITPAGLHRIAYYEWGDADNPHVVVCAHGLARTARDFATLGARLATRRRVVAADMPGRGASDWLRNPLEYQIPTYLADSVTLVARLGAERVDWVGTSMGGLVGMAYAALENTPIRRLVLNDAGPVVSAVALERIGRYLGKAPPFPDFDVGAAYVRMTSAPFGPHTEAEWRTLAESVLRRGEDGLWRLHYDPALAVPYNATPVHADVVLWPIYDAIRARTLVLRGAESDLLSRATVEEMTRRGPRASWIEFAGVGHAPTLMHSDQIEAVAAFLLDDR